MPIKFGGATAVPEHTHEYTEHYHNEIISRAHNALSLSLRHNTTNWQSTGVSVNGLTDECYLEVDITTANEGILSKLLTFHKDRITNTVVASGATFSKTGGFYRLVDFAHTNRAFFVAFGRDKDGNLMLSIDVSNLGGAVSALSVVVAKAFAVD